MSSTEDMTLGDDLRDIADHATAPWSGMVRDLAARADVLTAALREARTQWRGADDMVGYWRGEAEGAKAEVETLRAVRAEWRRIHEKVEAERDRLAAQVEAVRALADRVTAAGPPDGGTHVCALLADIRAALNAGKERP